MTASVVHKSQPHDVYIGRPSKWGNPYELEGEETRADVIEKYKRYILGNPSLLADLHELENKRLGCWCKPKACHGDVLVELTNQRMMFGEWK